MNERERYKVLVKLLSRMFVGQSFTVPVNKCTSSFCISEVRIVSIDFRPKTVIVLMVKPVIVEGPIQHLNIGSVIEWVQKCTGLMVHDFVDGAYAPWWDEQLA